MADDRIPELSSETERELELSPPQLIYNTTAWGGIHQLDNVVPEYQQDLFFNHLHSMPSLAPVTEPFVSAPTPPPVADLLISAPTQQTKPFVMNMARNDENMMLPDDIKQLSPKTKGISQPSFVASASTAGDLKRKGKEVHVECQDAKEAEYTGMGKQELDSPLAKKLQISREKHNLCEKRRAFKMTQQYKNLEELIPPMDKADQVSILDGAIAQIKLLEEQVQMLSMTTTPQDAKDAKATEQWCK